MRWSPTGALCLALSLAVASAAFAQEDAKAKAKEHFGSAVTYFSDGKYANALKEFEASFKLHPHWKIRYNIAFCHYHLQQFVDAANEFRLFLEEGKDKIPAKQLEETQSALEEIRKRVGGLSVTGKIETLVVVVDGVAVEGVVAGTVIYVLPGVRKVKVTADGLTLADGKMPFKAGVVAELKKKEGQTAVGVPEMQAEGQGGAEKKKPKTQAKKKADLKLGGWITLGCGAGLAVIGMGLGGLVIKEKGLMDDAKKDYLAAVEDTSVTDDELDILREKAHDHQDAARRALRAEIALITLGGVAAWAGLSLIMVAVLRKPERKPGPSGMLVPGPGSVALVVRF